MSSASDEALRGRIMDLAQQRRRFGYRRIHALLRREGVVVNHKKVLRHYQQQGLAVRKRRRRQGVAVNREPLELPSAPMTSPRRHSTLWSIAASRAPTWCALWNGRYGSGVCPKRSEPTRGRSSRVRHSTNGPMSGECNLYGMSA
ncbi:MAG: transposase [Nitrococcus mobilis]|nr:transposase [Nitrococcus mobilis]